MENKHKHKTLAEGVQCLECLKEVVHKSNKDQKELYDKAMNTININEILKRFDEEIEPELDISPPDQVALLIKSFIRSSCIELVESLKMDETTKEKWIKDNYVGCCGEEEAVGYNQAVFELNQKIDALK